MLAMGFVKTGVIMRRLITFLSVAICVCASVSLQGCHMMNDKANSWIPKPLRGAYTDADGNILTIGEKSVVSTSSNHCKKKSFFSIEQEDDGRIYQLRFYEGEHERGKDSDEELSSVINVLSETEISISGDCWHGKYTKKKAARSCKRRG